MLSSAYWYGICDIFFVPTNMQGYIDTNLISTCNFFAPFNNHSFYARFSVENKTNKKKIKPTAYDRYIC